MKILIDTGFWIALYNPEKHVELNEDVDFITKFLEDQDIIIPFPSLYEFLNSKFSRRNDALHFQKLLSKPNYFKLDDNQYKDAALINFFEKAINEYSDVSFVDEIIKEIISTEPQKIDYLISFDEGLNNFAKSRGINIYKSLPQKI